MTTNPIPSHKLTRAQEFMHFMSTDIAGFSGFEKVSTSLASYHGRYNEDKDCQRISMLIHFSCPEDERAVASIRLVEAFADACTEMKASALKIDIDSDVYKSKPTEFNCSMTVEL